MRNNVSFQTSSSREEIEQALSYLGYISYLSIQPSIKAKPRMSDSKQVIIIWMAAIIVILGVFLYLEWSTRP